MQLVNVRLNLLFYSRKDGKKIVDTDRIKIVKDQATTGFYELVINSVVPEDAGKYSCTSGNRFGEAMCEGEVTVTSKPHQ